MKITIEFDGYEDRSEMLTAIHANDLVRFVWEFEQHLRGLWKHGDSDTVSIDDLWRDWHEMKPQIEGLDG